MKKNYAYLFLFLTIGSFVVYRIFFPANPNNALNETLINLAVEILGSIVSFYLLGFLLNIKQLGLWFQSQVLYRKQKIRLSLSYVYRIRIKDKYLLVKNSSWPFYQPVGGVYKTLPEAQAMFNKFAIEPDKKMKTHGIAKDDLRVFVPAPKVIDFINWFHSKKDREISQWREFCEELIRTNILNWNDFPYVNYRYVGTVQTPLKKASIEGWECREILIYEVYDLLPNSEQMKILESLCDKGDTDYIKWATETQIQRLGYDEDERAHTYKIAHHTKWTLNLKWNG